MLAVRPLSAPPRAALSARAAVRGGARAPLQRRPARAAAPRSAVSVRADAAAEALTALSPLLLGVEDAFFGRRAPIAAASQRKRRRNAAPAHADASPCAPPPRAAQPAEAGRHAGHLLRHLPSHHLLHGASATSAAAPQRALPRRRASAVPLTRARSLMLSAARHPGEAPAEQRACGQPRGPLRHQKRAGAAASRLSRRACACADRRARHAATRQHLNYYRTGGVKLVHGVDPDADEAMLFNVGGQAGVPVSSQKSAYTARLVQEAGSMGACPFSM